MVSDNVSTKDLDYGADQIVVLEGLEAVRKRPGMYIGSTGPAGLHHLVYEVVDNSVDEAMAGHASRIDITLHADGSCQVEDDGRGIPVGKHKAYDNLTAAEVVLTVLHAGGKFGGGGYKVSGGLHGVGVSVVNALSTRVEVEIDREGKRYAMSFVDGGQPESRLQAIGESKLDANGEAITGTSVRFWPDGTIFDEVIFHRQTLLHRLQMMAFLNQGLEIRLRDLRGDKKADGQKDASKTSSADVNAEAASETTADTNTESTDNTETSAAVIDEAKQTDPNDPSAWVVFKYDGGIRDFVAYLNDKKEALFDQVGFLDAVEEDQEVEIAFQWNTGHNSDGLHSFANGISTGEGGMHEEGFRKSLTNVANRYARAKNILKEKDDNLAGEDIREGLTAIISVRLREPQFEGQTKSKLGNVSVRSMVERATNEKLAEWLEENPREARSIIDKSLLAQRARIAARAARDATRRKSALDRGGLPGKLTDCSSSNASECELYIVEGNSAGGSAREARDPRTMAVLPIRGKILNVERARIDKMLANTEVASLIQAIGAGFGEEFDVDELRYHKIVLLCDADVDGAHIRTLLLTFFFRQMRKMVEGGFVYIAQPPLYSTEVSKSKRYLKDDREKDEFLQAHPKHKADFARLKGLGEMNASELWDTTMDPEQRTLLQVTVEEAAIADEIFSTLMGENVEARKNFIQNNAKDTRFLDI